MPVSFTDSTSSTQLLAASNSGGVELGSATPNSTLTIAGRTLMSGSILAPQTISSGGLNRITGAVLVTTRNPTTVTVGQVAGFGIATVTVGSGGAFLTFGNTPGTTITLALTEATAGVQNTCSYSVI